MTEPVVKTTHLPGSERLPAVGGEQPGLHMKNVRLTSIGSIEVDCPDCPEPIQCDCGQWARLRDDGCYECDCGLVW